MEPNQDLVHIEAETAVRQTESPRLRTVAHKFGGSSVADAARYRHVAELLLTRPEQIQITVVSAMRGVTDELIALANAAAQGGSAWRARWSSLHEHHRMTARELLRASGAPTLDWLDGQFDELAEICHALSVLSTVPRETLELVQGLGEIFSARLLSVYLTALGQDCVMLDARDVLVTEAGELGVTVDWQRSRELLAAWRAAHAEPRVVVSGFVARNGQGRPTTLGRNGSDYSGAIFAVLFDAVELNIWTDVDGVFSADPRLVPEAVPLRALSYQEACELTYFGARIVHPQTMIPVMTRGLPILVRNSLYPERPGTRIARGIPPECRELRSSGAARSQRESEGAENPADPQRAHGLGRWSTGDGPGPVKGLSLFPGLALLNLEGAGMIGVPGTAERAFAALRDAQVSVVMISQGSSEHSICSVVREREADPARKALERAFDREIRTGQIQSVQVTPGISVLAAVGDGMAGTPGVAARLFGALARARVNVRAIAQGASERNISVAVDSRDATTALRSAHAGFWLSAQTISLGVIGIGRVGRALLDQLARAIPRLRRDADLDLRLRALADSTRMWLDDQGEVEGWEDRLASGAPCDLDGFARHLKAAHWPHTVIIDCSASDAVASCYAAWLAMGIHVITPNKKAGAGPLERYRRMRAAQVKSGSRFRYEATVGAGLPVISTLRDLLDTGDDLLAVEGVLSGTLSWLFNRFDGEQRFSALLREARALGLTEPDPRDDLAGSDVARKLTILAREAGRDLDVEQVSVENLVPEPLRAASREEFFARLEELDGVMETRLTRARASGSVLRHVAQLDQDGARVALVEVPADHTFARLRLSENMVRFTTRRYRESPLVVQGPGGGPEVTAAGVFADLLRVAAALGART